MNICRQIPPIGRLTRISTLMRLRQFASASTPTPPSPSPSTASQAAKLSRHSSSASAAPHVVDNADGSTNRPLEFFGSHAAGWTARQSHTGGGTSDERPWFQPIVISASLAVFMLYFCVLREESDIDGKLDGNLFDHVAGLEETQLQLAYNYNKEHGISTKALEERIAELAAQKAAAAVQ